MIDIYEITGEPAAAAEARRLIAESFQDLEFQEEGHIYTLHGKRLKSASGIHERFVRYPFDEQWMAVRTADKRGNTPDYWIGQWRCNSFKATTLGTKVHEFGESLSYIRAGHPEFIRDLVRPQYYPEYNYLAPIHPKEEAVELFHNELPSSMHLVANEARAYTGKNPDPSRNTKEQICGTFDMLYYRDGSEGQPEGFILMDYKTNQSLQNNYSRGHSKMLLPPFNDLYEEPLGDYTIQLSLYALMLEDIGIKVLERVLVWLKDDGTYETHQLPDVSDRLRKAL